MKNIKNAKIEFLDKKIHIEAHEITNNIFKAIYCL